MIGSLWRAADKIVFSETLTSVTSARTRTERDFEPDLIRQLKQSGDADLSVGGAELGGQALAAGLVDDPAVARQQPVADEPPKLLERRHVLVVVRCVGRKYVARFPRFKYRLR